MKQEPEQIADEITVAEAIRLLRAFAGVLEIIEIFDGWAYRCVPNELKSLRNEVETLLNKHDEQYKPKRRKSRKKICSKCKVPKDAVPENFYYRDKKKKQFWGVCIPCRIAYTKQHARDVKNGTYKKKGEVVIELTGRLKLCKRCDDMKDEAHFRTYETTTNGKVYSYRMNKCTECEADIEQEKRNKHSLFDETLYKDITDNYNR